MSCEAARPASVQRTIAPITDSLVGPFVQPAGAEA
jgi:hypothetical protein